MRTENSIKNIISNIFFNIVLAILGFVKIKVFIANLSLDIYSLNQLFYQIFSYLAIAEFGVGLVINKNLYEAFAKNDKKKIKDIYATSKKYFSLIGFILIIISICLSFFIQHLTKAEVSLSYMQIMFLVIMLLNVLDYFFAAPKQVIAAEQKNYEIDYLVKGIRILSIIVQIIMVLYNIDFILVIIVSIFIHLFLNIYINLKIFKKYPFLKNNKNEEKNKFNKKYIKGVGDLFPTKIAGLIRLNTDIIMVSTFIDPLAVTIYSSYNYITRFLMETMSIVAGAVVPSYANVLNGESKEKSFNVFQELSILFLFIASFVSIMLYGFFNNLIELWIGKEFLVNKITLILFIIVVFQNIASRGVEIIINSKGFFKETKLSMIIEAIINVVLSFILIKKYGICGVLFSTIFSILITTFIQKPIFVYKKVYNKSVFKYYLKYFFVLFITMLLMGIFEIINIKTTNIFIFLLYCLIFAIIVFIVLYILFCIFFKSFKDLHQRIKNVLVNIKIKAKKKIKK